MKSKEDIVNKCWKHLDSNNDSSPIDDNYYTKCGNTRVLGGIGMNKPKDGKF